MLGSSSKRAINRLDWIAPTALLPHGISGGITMVLGLSITLSSLFGDYTLLNSAALHVYCLSAFANAVSGILISGRSPSKTRLLFRCACIQQTGLVWFAFRFRPETNAAFPSILTALDILFTLCILAANGVYVQQCATWIQKEMGPQVAASIIVGVFGINLMAGYPMQMALGGDAWLTCVVQEYPRQREGFSGYIYVPTTWVFSSMLFGATLLNRKIISKAQFGIGFGMCVAGILVLTVISQEIHIPFVSTQRLIILCPQPSSGSLPKSVSEFFDISLLSQAILSRTFGMEFNKPGNRMHVISEL